jgi:hypothetical protein
MLREGTKLLILRIDEVLTTDTLNFAPESN